MRVQKHPKHVHVVSHGPHCLDGVTAAVVIARYHRDADIEVRFSSNEGIDDTLLQVRCDPPEADHVLWITDISWTSSDVDRHLQQLAARGVRITWIDHHRTAIERHSAGEIGFQPAHMVLSESYAASRLTFDYLRQQCHNDAIAAGLQRLVELADDNDRWLHRMTGSRQLALVVSAMQGDDAYRELLAIDRLVTYTPKMREVADRLDDEIRRSFALAEESRRERHGRGVTLVTALCDGYASEVADRWGQAGGNVVFALLDVRSMALSLRRSPDCSIDLSHLARRLGGGGHPAAAGCRPSTLTSAIATTVADLVEKALHSQS